MRKTDWITLDYLEFFCQQNHLVIGCKRGEEEVWISPLGPHPSSLTSKEVQHILRGSADFEIRTTRRRSGVDAFAFLESGRA